MRQLRSSINYIRCQKFLNGDLSKNLKKVKEVDNKEDFGIINEKKLKNKENLIDSSSLSFGDANNTNQLFLKENSNILSKLNNSKKK